MKYASLGSISSGTLRTEDLLVAFADELEHHVQRNAEEWCSRRGRKRRDELLALVTETRDGSIEDEGDLADAVLEELQDALGEFAPPYTYFGAHEGDGADFGYWPAWDAIEELPQVEDGDEAKALGEDCRFVNDHGNVTIYGGDGTVIWDCV
jgi:hypothetical protein